MQTNLSRVGILVLGLLLGGGVMYLLVGEHGPAADVPDARHEDETARAPSLVGGGAGAAPATPSDTPAAPTPAGSVRAVPRPELPARFVGGRVENEQGEPLEGVAIVAARRGTPRGLWQELARSDAEGRVAFWTQAPSLRLVPRADGWYCAQTADIQHAALSTEQDAFVFRMRRGHTIRGVVLGEDGAEGPARVMVSWSGRLRLVLDTDDTGRFSATAPVEAEVVTLSALGGLGVNTQLAVRAADAHDEVVLRLGADGVLTGHVVGPGDDPVTTGTLRIEEADGPTLTYRAVTPDTTGAFEVTGLVPGAFLLIYEPSDATLAPAAPLRVDVPGPTARIVVPRGVVFRGRVVPKAGDVWRGAYAYHDAATAQVRQRVVTVAPDGSFDIPSVRPGHGVVYLWSQDGRYALLRDPAESAERVTLQTHVGQTISGRIERDKADAPSSLSVSAMWDGPVVWRPADGAGRFVLPALPPGTYGLRWHAGAATGVFEMPARVPAGAKDVKVRLPR